jgi:hypothetical protein
MITISNHFTKMEASSTRALRNTMLLLATIGILAGCSIAPPTVVHETVGPTVTISDEQHNGFLRVFTATAWMTDGDGPSQLNYTDYQVTAADGSLFKEISNGNEEPARVTLPKGTYTVIAQSDTSGTVNVPVKIETGRITEVHLDGEWKEASVRFSSVNLVRLPNGQPIGFRAPHTELLVGPIVTAARTDGRLSPRDQ